VTGLLVLAAVIVAATLFGLWRARTDGRLRAVEASPTGSADGDGATAPPLARLSPADLGAPLGERATLVQFSSAFCAPCRATRQVLGSVAGEVDGVTYVEVDAESRLDLVRRVDVTRTPTVLVLDTDGRIVRRAAGAPSRAHVVAALGDALP
jgi:thiol-disulfide isomerase/thioredoxin